MATFLKARVNFDPVIESISRKFVPVKEKCQTARTAGPVKVEPKGWMGGGVRTTVRAGLGACKRNYLVVRENARKSMPSNDELAKRLLFKQVSAAVSALMKNLTQLSYINVMWAGGEAGGTDYEGALNNPNIAINGITSNGYTLRGWVFAVQYAGKVNDPNYDLSTWPHEYD